MKNIKNISLIIFILFGFIFFVSQVFSEVSIENIVFPELSKASVYPNVVKQGEKILITVLTTDNSSVNSIQIKLGSYSSTLTYDMVSVNDPIYIDSTGYHFRFSIPTTAQDGIWNIKQIIITDKSGNTKIYEHGMNNLSLYFKIGPTVTTGFTVCNSFNYSDWSECSSSNTQKRDIIEASPYLCVYGQPDSLLRICTNNTSDSTCTYLYSDWSSCQPSATDSTIGTKTRTVISKTPENCIGTPKTTETCTINNSTCTYFYSDWSSCQASTTDSTTGTRTRTVISSYPEGCTGTPITTETCTPSTSYYCEYTYSDWSDCQPIGTSTTIGRKTRTVISKTPENCIGTPKITETCKLITSTCTEDIWDCEEWGICVNGIQKRSCKLTFDCLSAITSSPVTEKYCVVEPKQEKCVYVFSDWSECKDGIRTRTITSKSPENCLSWNPVIKEECKVICSEDKWDCSEWTQCSSEGKQTRECNLVYDCDTVLNKTPVTERDCVYNNPSLTQKVDVATSSQEQEKIPEECIKSGWTNKYDCEIYLLQSRIVKECTEKGIKTKEECRQYLFNSYGSPLKCQGLKDVECNKIIDNIILADFKVIDSDLKKELTDSINKSATINYETQTLTVQSKEIKIENIPLVGENAVSLVEAKNKAIQENLSPVIIIIDSDGDGLSDDIEKRLGTDPYSKDTDKDGVDDKEELKLGTNPLVVNSKETKIELSQIEKAIINKESIEQPKFNDLKISEELLIEKVENTIKETGESNIRFQGKARPNEIVTLYFYSTMPIVVTVKADANGNWVYDLDKTLVDGTHEVYVAVNDDKGRIVESGLAKLFFVEEAKAKNIDDFIKAEDASYVSDKTDNMMRTYLIVGLGCILLLVLLFLFIRTQANKHNYE